MKKRTLTLILAILLLPAMLLSGCERDSATTDPTGTAALTETQAPTESAKATEPTIAVAEPEDSVSTGNSAIQQPSSAYPYGAVVLDGGKALLLYSNSCNYDVYNDLNQSGMFLYQAVLLSKTPLAKKVISMTAAGVSAYTCVLEDRSAEMLEELEDHPYLHALLLDLDPQKAVALYHTWTEATDRYLESRSAEDFEARKAARDAYTAYLGDGETPNIPYYAYTVTLTGSGYWDSEETVIHEVELVFGDERHTLPIGEIRAHSQPVAMILSDGVESQTQKTYTQIFGDDFYASYFTQPRLYLYSSQISALDRTLGQIQGKMNFYTYEDVTLDELVLMGQGNGVVQDIRVEQEEAQNGQMSYWDGETAFSLESEMSVEITIQLDLRDPQIMTNPLYHSAVQCAVKYSSATGTGVLPLELTIRPEPDYLALCALHLDGIDLAAHEQGGGVA